MPKFYPEIVDVAGQLMIKACRPCSDLSDPQRHLLLVLDPVKNKCSGLCGDGKRLRYDRFNMAEVELEECDTEFNGGISGCSLDCKVMEGYKCAGGDWNKPDVCVRIDNFEIKIQAVMTLFNDSVVHTNNFKYPIKEGEEVLVILAFNDDPIIAESEIDKLITPELEGLEVSTDFIYSSSM